MVLTEHGSMASVVLAECGYGPTQRVGNGNAEATTARCLFMTGELYQLTPRAMPERLLTAIQALIAPGTLAPAVRAQAFVTLGKRARAHMCWGRGPAGGPLLTSVLAAPAARSDRLGSHRQSLPAE